MDFLLEFLMSSRWLYAYFWRNRGKSK